MESLCYPPETNTMLYVKYISDLQKIVIVTKTGSTNHSRWTTGFPWEGKLG